MSSAVAAPASVQADRNGKGRVATLSGLSTIRARLYIALGFMAITTVICSLIGLYAFTNAGGTDQMFPEHAGDGAFLRLAEETRVAAAPRLMAAEDESHRSEVAGNRSAKHDFLTRIDRLRTLTQT
jgi:hypothetical protein